MTHLAERIEDVRQIVGGDAYSAIAHRPHDIGAIHAGAEGYTAVTRELDGVRQQVEQDLTYLGAIGVQGRVRSVHVDGEGQLFRARERFHERYDTVGEIPKDGRYGPHLFLP